MGLPMGRHTYSMSYGTFNGIGHEVPNPRDGRMRRETSHGMSHGMSHGLVHIVCYTYHGIPHKMF